MSAGKCVIVGAHEAPHTRHASAARDTESYLVEAALGTLADAGIERREVDGFGVASFSLAPDHAIDLAWRLGLRLRWLMEDTNGGASALNMLQHAVRAIESGDAETIVLCAGDRLDREEFRALVEHYNRATRDHLRPLRSAALAPVRRPELGVRVPHRAPRPRARPCARGLRLRRARAARLGDSQSRRGVPLAPHARGVPRGAACRALHVPLRLRAGGSRR
jgi:hypothetical protein